MIVVSNEREHEFEQERENESSENAKESRTRWRDEQRKNWDEQRKNCINHQESTSETTNVTLSHIVDFYQDLNTMPG